MPKAKMDEAAAERIRKARGNKDDFAHRAAMAARQNELDGSASSSKSGDWRSKSGDWRSKSDSKSSGTSKK